MLETVFAGWKDLNKKALEKLFDGDDESINRLSIMINGGKMLANQTESKDPAADSTAYINHFGHMMFATAAPLAWRMSNNLAFIIDMETKCDAKLIDYQKNRIDEKTFADSHACVGNQFYYLAMVPQGKTEDCPINLGHSNCNVGRVGGEGCVKSGSCTPIIFAQPPGIQNLDGKHSTYANISVEDFVSGYVQNETR